VRTITPRELNEKLQRGEKARLVDVRTPAEHAEIHVPGVELLPLDRLDPAQFTSSATSTSAPVYLLCKSGGRARQAAERLEKAGARECCVVEGGTMGWAEAGLPVNRGTAKVISLERQVRIAAGSLVLTGVLLGYFVHPLFIWLAAFIGAGLIFAGVTDWCGMGLLIARCPWNRRG
jgi:rhodanese-related sulfurtransferase